MPTHAILSIGQSLSPEYFSPGTFMMNGKVIGSLWAIAFYAGVSYRYERAALNERWVRVA